MAFINYTTNQLTIKIVYYGTGLSGKTTNLRCIQQKIDPASPDSGGKRPRICKKTIYLGLRFKKI